MKMFEARTGQGQGTTHEIWDVRDALAALANLSLGEGMLRPAGIAP